MRLGMPETWMTVAGVPSALAVTVPVPATTRYTSLASLAAGQKCRASPSGVRCNRSHWGKAPTALARISRDILHAIVNRRVRT